MWRSVIKARRCAQRASVADIELATSCRRAEREKAAAQSGMADVERAQMADVPSCRRGEATVGRMDSTYEADKPGGTNVSGGQKQLLSIARAWRHPILFDDSFSP